MEYRNVFIKVAEDCPVREAEVPVAKTEKKPQHLIQYELLTQHPYHYDHKSLIFALYRIRNGLPEHLPKAEREQLWNALFSKGHPCLRASALTKRYGFGAHYDAEGKIALYPLGSREYARFLTDKTIKVVPAMKSKR